MQLPYRLCVGIMLLNRSGLVCVGQRLAECSMVASADMLADAAGRYRAGRARPRGRPACARGGHGCRSVQVLAEAPGWFTYDLPAELIGVALKGNIAARGRNGSPRVFSAR